MNEDEIDKRIRELNERAMENYVEDPVRTALAFLEDMHSEYEGWQDESFVAGHRQAIHNVKSVYLSYSDRVECDCRYPFPEARQDDSWYCGDCGSELIEDGDIINPD